MSKAIEYDFQNVCRTCLSEVNLNSLFDKCRVQNSLDEMLLICTSIQYHVNDGLPVQICDECISELNQSYKFALKCRDADTKLRSYMQKLIPVEYAMAHHSFNEQHEIPLKDPLEISEVDHKMDEVELGIKTELDDTVINQLKDEVKVENIEIEPKTEHLLEVQADISKIRLLLDSQQSSQPQAHNSDINQKTNAAFEHQSKSTISDNESNQKPSSITCPEQPHNKTYSCPMCDTTYKHKSSLNYHILTHTGNKRYACTVCDKSFYQKSGVTDHMLTHSGAKTFSCPFCDVSFARNGDLKIHLRTHTGEKPFACTLCDRSFNMPQHLKYHMRRHTGEKPYVCSVCERSFRQSGDLNRHLLTHTGEKRFVCTVCDKSFKQKAHLMKHKQVHNK